MPLRRLVLLGLSFCILAAPAATLAQTTMAADLLKPNLVDIGAGRRLNFTCAGAGEPVVLFEQGEDAAIANWKLVQPAIAAKTRTCVYDRAGFGYSDGPDKPISGLPVTDDLRALLKAAGIDKPVVIVGHSIGGFYATLFADRFPAQVAGLVLVDPDFADQFKPANDKQRQAWWTSVQRSENDLVKCAALAQGGKLTPESPGGCITLETTYTPEEAAAVYHARTQPAWYENALAQSQSFYPRQGVDSLAWRQEFYVRRPFGGMPMAVLTAEVFPKARGQRPADYKAMADQWRAGHAQLAARSTRGKAIVVPASQHYIQLTQPQAVIDAVNQVVDQVRAGSEKPPATAKSPARSGKKQVKKKKKTRG